MDGLSLIASVTALPTHCRFLFILLLIVILVNFLHLIYDCCIIGFTRAKSALRLEHLQVHLDTFYNPIQLRPPRRIPTRKYQYLFTARICAPGFPPIRLSDLVQTLIFYLFVCTLQPENSGGTEPFSTRDTSPPGPEKRVMSSNQLSPNLSLSPNQRAPSCQTL